MLMKNFPTLMLLGILISISMPSTAQQLIRLQENAIQKASQPTSEASHREYISQRSLWMVI